MLPEKLPKALLDRKGHEFGAGDDLACRGCGDYIWEYWEHKKPCPNPVGRLQVGISSRGGAEAKAAVEKRKVKRGAT
jgi:hypothetical protein